MPLKKWLGRGSGVASFTVAWNAPETDADGSAVEAIVSYRVRWSQDILDRENAIRSALVAAPTATLTTPSTLTAGTWYAWVSTITANGESDVSPPLQVTAA